MSDLKPEEELDVWYDCLTRNFEIEVTLGERYPGSPAWLLTRSGFEPRPSFIHQVIPEEEEEGEEGSQVIGAILPPPPSPVQNPLGLGIEGQLPNPLPVQNDLGIEGEARLATQQRQQQGIQQNRGILQHQNPAVMQQQLYPQYYPLVSSLSVHDYNINLQFHLQQIYLFHARRAGVRVPFLAQQPARQHPDQHDHHRHVCPNASSCLWWSPLPRHGWHQ